MDDEVAHGFRSYLFTPNRVCRERGRARSSGRLLVGLFRKRNAGLQNTLVGCLCDPFTGPVKTVYVN